MKSLTAIGIAALLGFATSAATGPDCDPRQAGRQAGKGGRQARGSPSRSCRRR